MRLVNRGISRILIVSAIALVMIAAVGIIDASYSVSTRSEHTTSTLYIGGTGQPYSTVALTLHSVQYAESLVEGNLVIPNSTLIGASFNVAGARINGLPSNMNTTDPNGSTVQWIQWSVTLFVWNQAFTNGTTNVDIFGSGGLAIVETSAPPGGNSLTSAQELLTPNSICQTSSTTTHCQTESQVDSAYIVTINGLSIVVSPLSNQLTWLDSNRNIWINIVGGNVPMDQLLSLADNMTAPSSAI